MWEISFNKQDVKIEIGYQWEHQAGVYVSANLPEAINIWKYRPKDTYREKYNEQGWPGSLLDSTEGAFELTYGSACIIGGNLGCWIV